MASLKKLIGLSLSFCIKDMLLGRIKMEEVFMLYCKADPASPEMREKYSKVYWKGFEPEHVDGVLELLMPRIHRLDDKMLYIPCGVWVDAEQPHYWGPVNDGLGMEGSYLNFGLGGERQWSKSNGMFPVTTNHAKDMS